MIFPLPPLRTGPRSTRSFILQSAYWNLAALYRRTLATRTRVVAVTGSFGKTTTAGALGAALGCRNDWLLGYNAGRHIASHLLAIRPGERHRVIETAIEGSGQIETYARLIRPDIAVVTCIGSEHNRTFRTLEATRAEKLKLVLALPPHGTAFFNGDDPHVRWMAEQTNVKKVFFGLGPENDVRAEDIHREADGTISFTLVAHNARKEVRTRHIGRHQIYSHLAAAAVALHENIPIPQIVARLATVEPHDMRLRVERLDGGITLLRDEFKSTRETIETALDTFAEFPAQRRIVVIGEISEAIGSQYPHYRAIGERIGRIADLAICIGEHRKTYAIGAAKAGFSRENFVDGGRGVLQTIGMLCERLRPGDVVLLKGMTKQKLQRIALALQGRNVTCDLHRCAITNIECSACPLLERPAHKPG
jgi:UDP-N-acetylmuramoyl-tripeptide--D-alanyl-D-alanine ligase